MTENRDPQLPGAPIDETAPTPDEVAEAIARANSEQVAGANQATSEGATASAPTQSGDDLAGQDAVDGVVNVPAEEAEQAAAMQAAAQSGGEAASAETDIAPVELPSAAADSGSMTAAQADDGTDYAAFQTRPYTEAEVAALQADGMAAAGAGVNGASATSTTPDGAVMIPADHPMANFYREEPEPPVIKGNRAAGVLISLLATVIFAAVYAGVIALFELRYFRPEALLSESNLIPTLLSPGFFGAVGGFFLGMVLLVLVFGRSGWWAYVLGGFLVGVLAWVGATLGFVVSHNLHGIDVSLRALVSLDRTAVLGALEVGTLVRVLAAGVVAREVAVWFGAWIGGRGRRIKAKNAAAVAEYEAKCEALTAK
ncbi:hypothetical protein [Canibacter zhoujuaniae]|uniref:hypothetical protein n=1 Tax=Canibacter zhoujuaniae TaxID=2708343 RepID=UPI00142349EF|nr:hypothetical protein [Canibacter zhoujuaniae]